MRSCPFHANRSCAFAPVARITSRARCFLIYPSAWTAGQLTISPSTLYSFCTRVGGKFEIIAGVSGVVLTPGIWLDLIRANGPTHGLRKYSLTYPLYQLRLEFRRRAAAHVRNINEEGLTFRPRCPPYVNNTPRPHSATDGRHLPARRNRTRNARTHPNLGASRISSGIAAASGGGTDRLGPARTYACTYAAPGGPAPLPAHAAINAVRCTINVVRVPGGFLRFRRFWLGSVTQGLVSFCAMYAAPCLSQLLSPRAIDTAAASRSGSGSASTLHGRPCTQGLS